MPIYDSIAVGGGPAGSSAAYTMTRTGLKVLLLESERWGNVLHETTTGDDFAGRRLIRADGAQNTVAGNRWE